MKAPELLWIEEQAHDIADVEDQADAPKLGDLEHVMQERQAALAEVEQAMEVSEDNTTLSDAADPGAPTKAQDDATDKDDTPKKDSGGKPMRAAE